MLPRSHRLPAFSIKDVMKNGRRVTGSGITIIYLNMKSGIQDTDSQNQPHIPRLAFIVSTKIDKRAVIRNRTRRLMSESVQHLLPYMRTAIYGIFIASKGILGLTQDEMESRVEDVLIKAQLMNNELPRI